MSKQDTKEVVVRSLDKSPSLQFNMMDHQSFEIDRLSPISDARNNLKQQLNIQKLRDEIAIKNNNLSYKNSNVQSNVSLNGQMILSEFKSRKQVEGVFANRASIRPKDKDNQSIKTTTSKGRDLLQARQSRKLLDQ